MSALIPVFRLILFYTFISFSDGQLQWYDAVSLCKQQGQILLPEITSNESSFGYRQDTTMWTSSYILSVNYVTHTENSDKLIVLNIPLNYSYQDFKCKWDYIGSENHPNSLLNITKLSVVREVIDVMDFGQKYWLSDISESVYRLVQQCEVFNHVANSTSSRKSYTAMRYCDDMNTYKCIDGKKYRTAVSLVKYLHHRHWNDHGRKRMNYSGESYGTVIFKLTFLNSAELTTQAQMKTNQSGINSSDGGIAWKVTAITLSVGMLLIGIVVVCLILLRVTQKTTRMANVNFSLLENDRNGEQYYIELR